MQKALRQTIRELVLKHAGELRPGRGRLASKELWKAVAATGTRLWLDTGDMGEADALWCEEFSGLTTNNTLLNREVQKGTYDGLVRSAWADLKDRLDAKKAVIEIAFVLNAVHALRLVARFGGKVSVELHTDLINDAESTVLYAQRYHEICPESFIIKVPFTPAGLVATRRLSDRDVPVNFTLGFSARQNFAAAAFARPRYVNVFLGRLNAFVADSGLGDGRNVGERTTLASQRAVKEVNTILGFHVRQIAASMRSGEQVGTLAGVDVHTMPPKVVAGFESLGIDPRTVKSRVNEQPKVTLSPGVDEGTLTLSSLWDVPGRFKAAALTLARKSAEGVSPEAVRAHFEKSGFTDFLPAWSEEDIRAVQEDGKIPKLSRWKERFARGEAALDAVMNLSGLMSFASDQEAMDERIEGLME